MRTGNIIDITNKINNISADKLAMYGYTKEKLLQQQEKENAALDLCGGLLGDCYIMMEIISWLLDANGHNIFKELQAQKWYKQTIKQKLNDSLKALNYTIEESKQRTPTNQDFMQDFADNMYDELKIDIFKLTNGIQLYLGSHGINKNTDVIADFILINILLKWITSYYDSTIKECSKLYPAFYNSWYSNARNTKAAKLWEDAISLWSKQNLDKTIDLNNSYIIINGIAIIDKRMKDPLLTEKIRQKTLQYSEEGEGLNRFNKAMEILGIKTQQPDLKQELPIKEETNSLEESLEKLSTKFKVTHKRK